MRSCRYGYMMAMRMAKPSFARFSRTDWIGDSIVVIVCGAALLGSLFLPWANVRRYPRQNFSYALTKPEEVSSILSTDWGPPVLAVGIAVVVLGSLMLAYGPRRWTGGPISLALAIAALGVLYDVASAMHALYGWGYAAGMGVLVATVVGILLPVVALASAMTGRILRAQEAAGDGAGPSGPATPTAVPAELAPAADSESADG